MLRKWLLRRLRGLPVEELDAVRRTCDESNAKNIKTCDDFIEGREAEFNQQRVWFYDVIRQKDEEIKRLTNLMLQEHGIIRQPSASNETREMKPLNKRVPWKEKQEQLQRDDARKQADAVKAAWEKKNAG